jgi:nucleotide-binding universal stress UspA family protein
LTYAGGVAQKLGAHVVIVFAYYISPLGGGEATHDYRTALESVGEHEVARAVADLEAEGVDVSTRIEQGKAADVLLAVAAEVGASTIVVGSDGQSALSAALLGSVVLRLVQRSSIPVVVVPVPEAS